MPRTRIPVPPSLVDELLFKADHTCCICREQDKDVQLHHIDGNPAHNTATNIAVVCLDCHSKITRTGGLGRAYSPREVARYKDSWETYVQSVRTPRPPVLSYESQLLAEVDVIVCDILSRGSRDPRANGLLDLLFELHLYRGYRLLDDKIVEGLHHLGLMAGVSSPRLAALVAEKVWEMCFHYVGPEYVPMEEADVDYILSAIEALSTLGEFNSEFGHGRKAVEKVAEAARSFFEIGLWYSHRPVANAALSVYKDAIEGCYVEGDLKFAYGRTKLRASLGECKELLAEHQAGWRYQRRRIRQLREL